MNTKDLQAFAQEAALSIKTEADLNSFRQMLTKVTCRGRAQFRAQLSTWKRPEKPMQMVLHVSSFAAFFTGVCRSRGTRRRYLKLAY